MLVVAFFAVEASALHIELRKETRGFTRQGELFADDLSSVHRRSRARRADYHQSIDLTSDVDRSIERDLAELVRISEQLPDADLDLRTTLLARRRVIRSSWAGRYRSTTDQRLLQMEKKLTADWEALMDRRLDMGATGAGDGMGGGLDALATMQHNRMVDETQGRAAIETELDRVREELTRRGVTH